MSLIKYLTKIHFADNVLEDALEAEIEAFGLRRPMIVTDGGVAASGLVERLTAGLPARLDYTVFTATPGRPYEAQCGAAAEVYRAEKCDGLIGFGGGSPIDLAKAIALRATHDGPLRQYAAHEGGVTRIRDVLPPIIAIPTTAGTGSEVVGAAAIMPEEGPAYVLRSPFLVPKVAICDPTLTLGMRGLQFHEHMIENQLARYGLKVGDIRYVLHTHLHIDHAGKDDHFPMNTTVVVNRREMEHSVSGLMHPQYPLPDIKHLIDRLHTRNALRFEDLELSGPVEIIPGVVLEAANAHTEGSMNVHVETAEGIATLCGDVIYDINDQIVEPFRQIHAHEPQVTGNHAGSKRSEKAAIKKLLNSSRFLLPVHDKPARVEGGAIVGRLDMQVPGSTVQSMPRREWFAA